jgi:hypothetical protein
VGGGGGGGGGGGRRVKRTRRIVRGEAVLGEFSIYTSVFVEDGTQTVIASQILPPH